MIGYVMLGVDDLSKAREFYDPLLAMLGAVPGDWSNERSTLYVSQPGKPMFAITKPYNGQPASAGNGSMVALPCTSPATVDDIYVWVLANGATDEGAPGERGGEGSGFYGCYFRDALGNKLCVFYLVP